MKDSSDKCYATCGSIVKSNTRNFEKVNTNKRKRQEKTLLFCLFVLISKYHTIYQTLPVIPVNQERIRKIKKSNYANNCILLKKFGSMKYFK